MRKSGVIAVLTMVAAAPCAAQANFDTVQVRTTPITNSLYLLQASGAGNVLLSIGDDGVLMVDDQYAQLAPKVMAAIRELTSSPVRTVVNTHWHSDHTGGNENLRKAGAVIHASENVRRRMAAGQFIEALNTTVPPAPAGALPQETIADVATFQVNGDSVRVMKVSNAHTDGDVIVHFTKANVVHMGDVFTNDRFPFVDLTSGGSIHGIIETADRVLAMSNDSTRIIPGHGRVADRARLQRYRDVLSTLRDRVRTLISTGRTIEMILELDITRPYEREFPGNQSRFVRITHQELARR